MKRKIFSILFALVLLASFSLVTAVPVAAGVVTSTFTVTGGTYTTTVVDTENGTIEAALAGSWEGLNILGDFTATGEGGLYVTGTEWGSTADISVSGTLSEDIITFHGTAVWTAGDPITDDVVTGIAGNIAIQPDGAFDADLTGTVFAGTPEALPITIYISGSMARSITNVRTAESFFTIQLAIDDADTEANDTISVAAGTYDESGLKINKSLTISGTGTVTITGTKGSFDEDLKFHGSYAPGTKILGSMDYVVGVYNSADVDFVNVTIDGANNLSAPASDQYFAGVAFYNAQGSFSGCEIKRTASNPAYCGGAAVSIYIDTDSGTWELEVSNNCTFNTWPKNAISAYGSGSTLSNVLTVDVDDSTFTGNDGSGPSHGFQNGVVGLGGLDMEVDKCTFSAIRPAVTAGIYWAAPVLAGYAYKDWPDRYAPAHDLTVNDCTFSVTGDKFVRRSGGVWIITTGTATVSGCTFTNIKGIGVDGSNSCDGDANQFNPSSQDVTISNCTFNGPSFPSSVDYYMCGVNIQRGAQVDIEICSFSGFDDDGGTAAGLGGDAVCFNPAHLGGTDYYTGSCGGSIIGCTFSGCSTGIWVDEDVTPLTISYNNFDGSNEYGVWNADKTPDEITAENNWWGGVAGPQHDTNPYNDEADNQDNDTVSDNVDYLPWMIHTELQEGWNIYSTPIAPDASSDTIDKALNLCGSGDKEIAYYYNGETQYWDEPTSLTPLQAVYIKMAAAATIDVVVSSEATFPPLTDMHIGWNLVGPAELGKRLVDTALFDAYLGTGVAAALQGYSKALSPPLYQSNWTYLRDEAPTDKYFVPTEGYWVLMVNQGILGGVTTTPIKYKVLVP